MLRRRRLLLVTALLTCALAAPASAQADCAGADVTPANQGTPAASQATLCLLNGERAANGVPALTENALLTQASQAYSDLMIAKAFFAHETPDGVDLVTRLSDAGYLTDNLDDWSAGENLAWAQGDLATPRSIVSAWMGSPGHRENILNADFTEIGFGITLGTPTAGSSGATYATDFGRRHVSAPKAQKKPATRTAAQKRAARRKARAKARARARRAAARTAQAKRRSQYRVKFISG
jgi:uncharacterized protein YkwD